MAFSGSNQADNDGIAAPVVASPATLMPIEDQLASIIESARSVAIVAEELLREVVTQGSSQSAEGLSSPGKLQHRLNVAPRLLAATEQQLESLLAMLRMA